MKREWQKPKILVLVRGKAEENVLSACKGDGVTSSQDGASVCHDGAMTPCTPESAS